MSGLTGELFLCLERTGDPPDMFVCRDMAGWLGSAFCCFVAPMGNEIMMRLRHEQFDALKCWAILWVVFGHLADCRSGSGLFQSIFLFAYAWHMPVFIFLSGLFDCPRDEFPAGKVVFFLAIGILYKLLTFTSAICSAVARSGFLAMLVRRGSCSPWRDGWHSHGCSAACPSCPSWRLLSFCRLQLDTTTGLATTCTSRESWHSFPYTGSGPSCPQVTC